MSNFEPGSTSPASTPPTVPPPSTVPPPPSGGTGSGGITEQGKQVAGTAAEQGKQVANRPGLRCCPVIIGERHQRGQKLVLNVLVHSRHPQPPSQEPSPASQLNRRL